MKNLGKAQGTYPGRLQADTIAVVILVATVEQHFTAPTGANIAIFSATDNFYCLINGQTAAVPVATSVSFPSPNTVPELNPTLLAVTGGTTLISLVASGTPTITISFYQDTYSAATPT